MKPSITGNRQKLFNSMIMLRNEYHIEKRYSCARSKVQQKKHGIAAESGS